MFYLNSNKRFSTTLLDTSGTKYKLDDLRNIFVSYQISSFSQQWWSWSCTLILSYIFKFQFIYFIFHKSFDPISFQQNSKLAKVSKHMKGIITSVANNRPILSLPTISKVINFPFLNLFPSYNNNNVWFWYRYHFMLFTYFRHDNKRKSKLKKVIWIWIFELFKNKLHKNQIH